MHVIQRKYFIPLWLAQSRWTWLRRYNDNSCVNLLLLEWMWQ